MNCIHCDEICEDPKEKFCCLGCKTAYQIINNLGFKNYYQFRILNNKERKIKPDLDLKLNLKEIATAQENETYSASIIIQGLHCAACVWLIENILKKSSGIISAHVNLSKKTLNLKWRGDFNKAQEALKIIQDIGYRLLPINQQIINEEEKKYNQGILKYLAISGFGAGNLMLVSFALWFYDSNSMGTETRNLLHLYSAIIAIPVIALSSLPFIKSAYKSISKGYANMDLMISIAIILSSLISLIKTFNSAEHVYFDSAVMLIFFLLIGRYLDLKVRKKAFNLASEFSLIQASYGRILVNNRIKTIPSHKLEKGMILLTAIGEKIASDGLVIEGKSEVDQALITGESMPKKISVNSTVYSGSINLGAPIKISITKPSKDSILSKIVKITEDIENKKSHYVKIADKLSKLYIPIVSLLSIFTFILWKFFIGSSLDQAISNTIAVLIIACPCALALAVPVVQTISISKLLRSGIIVKSGEVIEKITKINNIIFDKTGSLTIGKMSLQDIKLISGKYLSKNERDEILKIAASITKSSNHPLSRSITLNYDKELFKIKSTEYRGQGLEGSFNGKKIRLGKKEFCQINSQYIEENDLMTGSLFMKIDQQEIVLIFNDHLKSDSKSAIADLRSLEKKLTILSGDSKSAVSKVAKELQIKDFHYSQSPIDKINVLKQLKKQSKQFIMVGDGINDAPALALADISISFSNASDLSQNSADIIIQKDKLGPIPQIIKQLTKANLIMKQNLAISLLYNSLAVPFAIMGYVTPLFAVLAMSSSSLLVIFNSLRAAKTPDSNNSLVC